MVSLWKIRGHDNFENNFFDKNFAILRLTIFKALDKGNFFCWNLSILTKTEDKNASACPDRNQEMVIRSRGRVFPAVFHRLVCFNDKPVKFCINPFPARKCNFYFYFSLPPIWIIWDLLLYIETNQSNQKIWGFMALSSRLKNLSSSVISAKCSIFTPYLLIFAYCLNS